MGSTDVASSISQRISELFTNIVQWFQDALWSVTEWNAQLWLWMPKWLEVLIFLLLFFVLYKLAVYAYRNRGFWQEIIQGKY